MLISLGSAETYSCVHLELGEKANANADPTVHLIYGVDKVSSRDSRCKFTPN